MIGLESFFGLLQHAFFIAAGILGIGFLIGFHEFGHFIFCKIFKIRTPSFSIGMGPRLFTKKIGGTAFSISAIPLGGYVEIAGAENDSSEQTEGSFNQKPYYQKMLVIAGGIFFNIMFAYAALSTLYFMGMPKTPLLYPKNASTTISTIESNSPAEKSNLKINDSLRAIDGMDVFNNPEKFINYLKERPQQPALLIIDRNGQQMEISTVIGEQIINDKTFGYFGAYFLIPRYSLAESIQRGISSTHTIIDEVWRTFKSIFSKRGMEKIGGPLMVISQTIKSAERGFKIFLLLLAFISINLAVLNVIPLPIFDGGQALFYTIEAIIRKPLPEKIKMYIHYTCWIGIIILAIFLSINDIMRMIGMK